MTNFPEVFASLAAPFAAHEVKTRAGGGGRSLSYVTARTVMNRFDEAVGPENWRNRHRLEHISGGADAVVCTIEVRVGGEWVAKEDAGGFKEMTERSRSGEQVEDEENTVKTAYSDAFKRCAVLWGVGRYLYQDGAARFNDEPARESYSPRPGPSQQYPAPTGGRDPQANGHADQPRKYDDSRAPTTGRGLFAWSKAQEEKHDVRLIDYLNKFIRANEFPGRMVDLDADQVRRCHAEAVRKIASLHAPAHDADLDGPRDAGSEG